MNTKINASDATGDPKVDAVLAFVESQKEGATPALRAELDAVKREVKRRAGRKPKPESERRTRRYRVCLNEAEDRRVRAYVGERETAEVLRELILGALPPEASE